MNFRQIILALYMIVIATLSLWPGESAPSLNLWDKLQHFGAYGLMGVLICWALDKRKQRLTALAGAMGFGLLMEVAQGVTGRDASLLDASANGLGLIGGVIGFWVLLQGINHLNQQRS